MGRAGRRCFSSGTRTTATPGEGISLSKQDSRTDWLAVGIGFFSFVVLGMPGALLNVAWSPSMRGTFGLPLDAVGALFLASTSGYFAASSASGRWMARYGLARLLTASTLASALGLLGLAL